MNARRDSTDGPENVDELFAEIVAGLERDGVGKDWLDLDEAGTDEPEEAEPEPRGSKGKTTIEETPSEPEEAPERHDDSDHFVPPEPPPFPVLRASTIGALCLFVLGILLLVTPGIFGLQASLGTPLSLVALCAGVGWLILRMRNTPPPDSGWDDGAQV